MKIGIFINTPAQVHFYKNIIKGLVDDGNEVYIVARDYGETFSLLKNFNILYFSYSSQHNSKIGKVLSLPDDMYKAYLYLKRKKVDIIIAGGTYNTITHLLHKPHIGFYDGEPMLFPVSYSLPFKLSALLDDVILTPESFRQNLGKKHLKIKSFKEMSYLHPKYFKINSDIYDLLGISASEDYVLLRFCAFDALHDVGINGFSNEQRIKLVKSIEKYAHVFISSETAVPNEIKDHLLRVPNSAIHQVIGNAKLVITDTGTMNTEAAILGIPSIRYITIGGKNDLGVFLELENKYRLMFTYNDPDKAIEKAIEIVQKPDLKIEWSYKREKLLAEKIDMNQFMIWFIENYPDSYIKIKSDPSIQNNFK